MDAVQKLHPFGPAILASCFIVALVGCDRSSTDTSSRNRSRGDSDEVSEVTKAKTSEATNTVGKMSRDAASAFERENAASEELGENATSSLASKSLCGSASPVPSFVPKGVKYEPSARDFDTGDKANGWKCLNFNMRQPFYYQYHYVKDGKAPGSKNPEACDRSECYEAMAKGDLDGDGVESQFSITGMVKGGELKKGKLFIDDKFE